MESSPTASAHNIISSPRLPLVALCWSLVATSALCFVRLVCKSLQCRHLFQVHRRIPIKPVGTSTSLSEVPPGCYETAANFLTLSTTTKTLPIEPSCPALPVELIEQICDLLFELKPPVVDPTGNAPVTCSKPSWLDVHGLMHASPDLHSMGFMRWLRVITIRQPGDWIVISPHQSLIR